MSTAKAGTSTNAQTVYNTLRAKGYSAQAAAGIIGNLQQESGISPGSKQVGGAGRGIAQWGTGAGSGGRWDALTRWATANKQNPANLSTQINYMLKELVGYGQGPGSAFAKSTNVNAATLSFEKVFERAGTPNMSARNTYANNAYAAFSGNPVTKAAPAKAAPAKATPGIVSGPALMNKSAPTKAPPPTANTGKKSGQSVLGQIGDNLMPDNLGGAVSGAVSAIPNPLTGIEAVGSSVSKITTSLFSVSFWIRAAFIIVGIALVFIGTKALLSGGAPTPTLTSVPTSAPTPSKARKPFGRGISSDLEGVAA